MESAIVSIVVSVMGRVVMRSVMVNERPFTTVGPTVHNVYIVQ